MNLETFFGKFELFADAPDAVAKMRELVLKLAVQGRLVDRVDADEPVDRFLRRIWANQNRSRRERTDLQKAEPFAIPSHWRWVALAEVSEFFIGKTPPRGDSSFWHPGEHPWASIADMTQYGIVTNTREKVSALAAENVFRQRFAEPDSILMSFKLTIGKVSRTTIRCFHNEAIISLLPPERELREYLFRFLPVFAALQTSNNAIKGNTLNKGLLIALPVALPPLAEQKRIVVKVDELMALCDRLEAQQHEREMQHAALSRAALARFADAPTPANLELLFHKSYAIPPADLRKSILTLAVQGKLGPQDPNDEPASALICRAQEERRRLIEDGSIKKVKILEEKEHVEVGNLPTNWASCPLDDIALKITDGEHATPVREEHGYYLLSARNVRDGFIDVSDVDYVGKYEFERIRKRCDPNAGDILLSCSGSIGRVAIVDADNKYAMVRSAAMIKQSQASVDSHYLSVALRSPYLQKQIELSSKQSAQANLFIEPIRRLVVPIPPLAEQRRIVAKVDELMALVDKLEAQLASARATAINLLAAAVAELTKGNTACHHAALPRLLAHRRVAASIK